MSDRLLSQRRKRSQRYTALINTDPNITGNPRRTMKTQPEAISFDDAVSPAQDEPAPDVVAWQTEQLKQRHKDADEGRFASPDAVKAVIRKFVPNG